jgi:hypothetical protein
MLFCRNQASRPDRNVQVVNQQELCTDYTSGVCGRARALAPPPRQPVVELSAPYFAHNSGYFLKTAP